MLLLCSKIYNNVLEPQVHQRFWLLYFININWLDFIGDLETSAPATFLEWHPKTSRALQVRRGPNMMIAMPSSATAEPSRSQAVGRTESTSHSHRIATAM